MRAKEDINFNQCDKCGKFVGNDNLSCASENSGYEGEALCGNCLNEVEPKEEAGKGLI